MTYSLFLVHPFLLVGMLTNPKGDRSKANVLQRMEHLRHLFKSLHREHDENEDEPVNKKPDKKADDLEKTKFEDVIVKKRPAVSVSRKKSTLRWKKSKSDSKKAKTTEKKDDSEAAKKKDDQDVSDLPLTDVQQHRDFLSAHKMMSELKKRKMIDGLLNASETVVIRKMFENDMVEPTNAEVKLLHRALNNLWEEVMCNITQFHFEREAIVFLCEREKVKARFLDVMLLYPHFIPDTWGGRHFCDLLKSVGAVANVHHDEGADPIPSPIVQTIPSQWTKQLQEILNAQKVKAPQPTSPPAHGGDQEIEHNKKAKTEKAIEQTSNGEEQAALVAVDDEEKEQVAGSEKRKRSKKAKKSRSGEPGKPKTQVSEDKGSHEIKPDDKKTEESAKKKKALDIAIEELSCVAVDKPARGELCMRTQEANEVKGKAGLVDTSNKAAKHGKNDVVAVQNMEIAKELRIGKAAEKIVLPAEKTQESEYPNEAIKYLPQKKDSSLKEELRLDPIIEEKDRKPMLQKEPERMQEGFKKEEIKDELEWFRAIPFEQREEKEMPDDDGEKFCDVDEKLSSNEDEKETLEQRVENKVEEAKIGDALLKLRVKTPTQEKDKKEIGEKKVELKVDEKKIGVVIEKVKPTQIQEKKELVKMNIAKEQENKEELKGKSSSPDKDKEKKGVSKSSEKKEERKKESATKETITSEKPSKHKKKKVKKKASEKKKSQSEDLKKQDKKELPGQKAQSKEYKSLKAMDAESKDSGVMRKKKTTKVPSTK